MFVGRVLGLLNGVRLCQRRCTKKGSEYSPVRNVRNIAEMLLGLIFEATESGTVPVVEIEA